MVTIPDMRLLWIPFATGIPVTTFTKTSWIRGRRRIRVRTLQDGNMISAILLLLLKGDSRKPIIWICRIYHSDTRSGSIFWGGSVFRNWWFLPEWIIYFICLTEKDLFRAAILTAMSILDIFRLPGNENIVSFPPCILFVWYLIFNFVKNGNDDKVRTNVSAWLTDNKSAVR